MACDVWVAVCQPFVKRMMTYDDGLLFIKNLTWIT